MSNTTLYPLTEEFKHLLWFAENLDADEHDESIDLALKALQDKIQNKAEGVSYVWRELMARSEDHRVEARRHQDRARVLLRRADRLKNWLVSVMQQEELKEIKWKAGGVALHGTGGPQTLDIDETLLPEQYFTETITRTPNREAIGHALKNGDMVAGVSVIPKGPHVRFH
tara:strand:- start:564 stop:1073 length:510 start_codon:yes stop_codon:yes gene_type:complete